MTIALLVIYAISSLMATRLVFRQWYEDFGDDSDWNWGTLVTGLILSLLLGSCASVLVWPYLGLQALNGRRPGGSHSVARLLAGEASEDKIKRLEREQRRRDLHIAKLERELEIGPYAR